MQNEYINREAAIRAAEAQCVDGKMYGNDEAEGTLIEVYALIDKLGDLPAADVVEVVHGKWKPGSVCSICDMQSIDWYKYCPNCGCDMLSLIHI